MNLKTRNTIRAWQYLSPMLVVLIVVAAWPLSRTIWFSFTNATLDTMHDYTMIGFSNYLSYTKGEGFDGILVNDVWWSAVQNTLFFVFFSVCIETILGVAIALVLNKKFPLRGLMRAIILVPWAIPTIVSAKIWAWMLNDQWGIINSAMISLGLIQEGISWTSNSSTAIWVIIMVDVWKTTPFMALLALAALQTVPKNVYEAAKMDGIPAHRQFLHLTLPLILAPLSVAITFRILDAMRVFDLIYVLTPNNQSVISMSVFAQQQMIEFSNTGYGSTAATLLFLTIGFIVIGYFRITRERRGRA